MVVVMPVGLRANIFTVEKSNWINQSVSRSVIVARFSSLSYFALLR